MGLSPYSRDAARSWAAEAAKRYRKLSGEAEDVLILKPDIVVAGRFTKRATRELLKEKGLRVVEFDVARSLDDAKRQMAMMGALIGHPERAAAENARLDAAIARTRAATSRRGFRVLALSRRGWVSGGDSLTASLLTAAGPVQRGRRARPKAQRLRHAGADRRQQAGPAAGLERQRFRRGPGPRVPAAPGDREALSAGEAPRHFGATDRVRRPDAARRARPAHRRDRAREPLTCLPRCGCWSGRHSRRHRPRAARDACTRRSTPRWRSRSDGCARLQRCGRRRDAPRDDRRARRAPARSAPHRRAATRPRTAPARRGGIRPT